MRGEVKGLWIQFHIPLITLNYRPGLSRPGPVSIEWKPRPIPRGAKGIFQKKKGWQNTASLGISVMLLSGTEEAATSAPDKSMTLNPKLGVYTSVNNMCSEEVVSKHGRH